MPAQAAISTRHDRDAREEDSNPPRLGRGDTRGSTGMAHSLRLVRFNSSRGVRVLHAALRRRRFEVRVLAGAPFQIPPWQRSAMHSSRKGDHAGAAPAGGLLSNGGRDVTASIRSCEDRRAGAAPVGLPISKSARSRNRRGGGLQTRSYPRRSRAAWPVQSLLKTVYVNAVVSAAQRLELFQFFDKSRKRFARLVQKINCSNAQVSKIQFRHFKSL